MYPRAPQMSPMTPNRLGGSPVPTPETPTALRVLNDRFREIHGELIGQCGRIDSALQRMLPQPQGVAEPSKPAGAPTGALHQLEVTASEYEQTLGWLRDLASRLERIA